MKKKSDSKHFSDPASVRASSPEPNTHRTGSPCVELEGHMASTKKIQHVTSPAKENAGSHDAVVREDGSELKGEGEQSAKMPAWRKGK
jgi:hypothetical protein